MTRASLALCTGVAVVSLAWGSAAAARHADSPGLDGLVSFDIPSMPLDLALLQYARQSGVQVISASSLLGARVAPALMRTTTPRMALELLLRDAGLSFGVIGANTVTIVRAQPAPATRQFASSVPAPRRTAAPAPEPDGPTAPSGVDELEEVVVTATRQVDTVNRVPLSITAETQKSLDQQGVSDLASLRNLIPALQVTPGVSSGVSYPAIRGIFAVGDGVAATTGLYLDDTPLQKRNPSTTGQAGGTPMPPLFDVERIEVLRGPQGTLFGASSEGGAIRYITPQPSLTRYSAYGRVEAAGVKDGAPSVEAGIAVGGPLVPDRLGFRVSLFDRRNGGYIDLVDRNTGQVYRNDANSGETRLGRLAVTWAPSERLRLTGSFFSSREHQDARVYGYDESTAYPIVEPTACFNTASKFLPGGYLLPVATGQAACAAASARGAANFTRPGGVYGPYVLGPGKSIDLGFPATTSIRVASLTADYDFPTMTVKSITSYLQDQLKSEGGNWSLITSRDASATYGPIGPINRGIPISSQCDTQCLGQQLFYANNRRYGFTQEVRFASSGDARPLSWVAGVFYSNMRITSGLKSTLYDPAQLRLEGLTVAQSFGAPLTETASGVFNGFDVRSSRYKDIDTSLFGEANYWVADKLRLTAGVRISRVQVVFSQDEWGPVFQTTAADYAAKGYKVLDRQTTDSPITPRFTAEYQLDPGWMVYATASKGFRPGGANVDLPVVCNEYLLPYGRTVADTNKVYNADSTWNFELGGKFRVLDGRVQVNADLFRIDWSNTQIATTIPLCGLSILTNAGQARSQGGELEVQARLARSLTVNLAAAYTDAEYTQDAVVVAGVNGLPPLLAAVRGQKFDIPPWTVRLGARYDFEVARLAAFARADYSYQRAPRGTNYQLFGVFGYAPDRVSQDVTRTDLRLGILQGGFELSVFVENLFDNLSGTRVGGRTNCAAENAGGTAACSSYTTYDPIFTQYPANPPRKIGVRLIYRR